MRLAKFLASAGIASRRKAEEYIAQKRIKVNGELVSKPGFNVDPAQDRIELDGRVLKSQRNYYVLLNKPRGYISTVYDPQGRPTVVELLKGIDARLFPVGRLDYDTEGLLLLTNDGDFAHLIMHPRYELTKKYRAWVKGDMTAREARRLEQGVLLEDGLTAPARVWIRQKKNGNTLIELQIHEGRNRQVKRMCEAVGHPVISLRRTHLANLSLKGLKTGEYRFLEDKEVEALMGLAKSQFR